MLSLADQQRHQPAGGHSRRHAFNTMSDLRLGRRTDRRPDTTWLVTSGAHVFYRPRTPRDSRSTTQHGFPPPLIGPRRTRPHAIHILTYPSGYIPRELRPPKASRKLSSTKSDLKKHKGQRLWKSRATQQIRLRSDINSSRPGSARHDSFQKQRQGSSIIRPTLAKFFSSSSSAQHESTTTPSNAAATRDELVAEEPVPTPSAESGFGTEEATGILAGFAGVRGPAPAYDIIPHHLQPNPSTPPRHRHSLQATPCGAPPPLTPLTLPSSRSLQRHTIPHNIPSASVSSATITTNMAARLPPSTSAPRLPTSTSAPGPYKLASGHRSSLMSVRSAKSAVTSLVTEVPKPVASGSGVSCSIILAEPNIFLSGFDHDGHAHREGNSGTALLRGRLQLNVTKNVKVKAVQLKLLGRARTEWPEGIPPLKQDMFEEEGLRTQVLTFYNAMNDGWETEYGNQCTYRLKNSSASSSTTNLVATNAPVRPSLAPLPSSASSRTALSTKDLKRLSLQNQQSRSFGKGDSPVATPTQAKGFKVFYPGTYNYTFELPIDHHQLETTKLQYGSVKWELHATVDRAGAFKPNLHGMKEVSIVRVPDHMSLETVEPISISRQWEDQLHYDIIISGKSFPIGSKIPIAFKLTPLAKVQVHKLKVFVTESIEYWTNDKRVTRKDPGRKILLLEKSAGKPLDNQWSSSEMRTVRGGELTREQREEARNTASRRRNRDSSRGQVDAGPLPEATENLLGDIDLGLEHLWGSTEIEANVQIPTCEMMAKHKELRLHPDCSWKNVNVFHWIKIVMRISRLDPDDPTGQKRRHFEISIDSPFTVLDCRATQANTNLPAYAGSLAQPATYQSSCGCPDASTVCTSISPSSSTGTLNGEEMAPESMLPAPPQAAHLHTHGPSNPASMSPTQSQAHAAAHEIPVNTAVRPIHLLRVPSYNPPAFDDDTAPPPLPELVNANPEAANAPVFTPPPQYDVVVGTPSVDGMADYFARLAEHGYDDEDSSDSDGATPSRILERSGRVNVAHPRTPGGRMPSRSLEIARPDFTLDLSSLPARAQPRGVA